jgi:peptide/nickel transport system ATP-binding protein
MRQRVMIAMALACEPQLLIADEPTTALDVTIQAQILELLADLQKRLRLSVVMITHDLGVIAQLCHRVAVMYAGEIVETGEAQDIFEQPVHPYTQGLLRATPRPDEVTERMVAIDGVPPDLIAPPPGCAFVTRCDRAREGCANRQALTPYEENRQVSCWCALQRLP